MASVDQFNAPFTHKPFHDNTSLRGVQLLNSDTKFGVVGGMTLAPGQTKSVKHPSTDQMFVQTRSRTKIEWMKDGHFVCLTGPFQRADNAQSVNNDKKRKAESGDAVEQASGGRLRLK